MTDAAFLLDPWSTLVSIGLIRFMPADAKLAVCNNRIEFYSSGPLDRLWRTLMDKLQSGYSRTAVLYFVEPLNIAMRWYATRERMVVFEEAREGLRVLRKLYSTATDDQSRMVVQLLDGYIKSLTQCIRSAPEPESTESLPTDHDDTDSNHSGHSAHSIHSIHASHDESLPSVTSLTPSTLLAQSTMSMRDIWCREEIDIITQLFGLLKSKKAAEQQPIVDSIRKLIDSKHPLVSELAKVRTARIVD